jgi:hypothetical protein
MERIDQAGCAKMIISFEKRADDGGHS